jgi:hypothetical protein
MKSRITQASAFLLLEAISAATGAPGVPPADELQAASAGGDGPSWFADALEVER